MHATSEQPAGNPIVVMHATSEQPGTLLLSCMPPVSSLKNPIVVATSEQPEKTMARNHISCHPKPPTCVTFGLQPKLPTDTRCEFLHDFMLHYTLISLIYMK